MVVLTLLVFNYALERQARWANLSQFVAILYQVQSLGTGRLDLRFLALHISVCGLHALPERQGPGVAAVPLRGDLDARTVADIPIPTRGLGWER